MKVAKLTALHRYWMTVFLGVLVFICTLGVQARPTADAQDLPTVWVTELPREGQETFQLIHQGGPFPYEKDGTVFGNRERILPRAMRGFYREYTVRTPGIKHRGARRIVCGGQAPRKPEACYYTSDHYASFRMIVVKP
jgi:ribonuclease T1